MCVSILVKRLQWVEAINMIKRIHNLHFSCYTMYYSHSAHMFCRWYILTTFNHQHNKTACDLHGRYSRGYFFGVIDICDCNHGYWDNCCSQELNACASFPCQHRGTCTPHDKGYTCTCTPKSYGRNCENFFNVCDGYPCKNAATCTPTEDGFICTCYPGSYGQICENGKTNI
ncbi:DLL [Mytilus coruscus]|uniref:DLL n=1 Tax=Mytilus coruscus TaxID=42192 RepID=A0A6J8D103_MYTCO|nr:DLL [Mytilus coruscus]